MNRVTQSGWETCVSNVINDGLGARADDIGCEVGDP